MPRIYEPNCKDMTGKKFGRLTVISRAGRNKYGYATWNCLCDCGNTVVVSGKSLRDGNTKSCGCLNIDVATDRIVSFNYKHGGSHSKLFHVWSSMKARCNDQNNRDYGARGIRVCDEWKDFENFRDWAETNGYSEDLTIERLDFNGNYEPSNCTWIPPKEQAKNRRSSRKFIVDGETRCISDWSEFVGLEKSTLGKLIERKSQEEAQRLVEEYVRRGHGVRKPYRRKSA